MSEITSNVSRANVPVKKLKISRLHLKLLGKHLKCKDPSKWVEENIPCKYQKKAGIAIFTSNRMVSKAKRTIKGKKSSVQQKVNKIVTCKNMGETHT